VTPSKFLRSHSSFESIRKQAKKLVRQVAASDPEAVARVRPTCARPRIWLRRLAGSSRGGAPPGR